MKVLNYRLFSVKDMESKINSKLEFEGYPFSAYSRLFLPSLIDDDIDKVLYPDPDSLVEGSLKEVGRKIWINITVQEF